MALISFGQILRGLVSCKWSNSQIEGKRITNQQSFKGRKLTNLFLKTQNLRDVRIFKNDFFLFLPSKSC
jgi:hypothetical protein